MNILSIEPTPSPNTMKLNMDERLPEGERKTYTAENLKQARGDNDIRGEGAARVGACPPYIEKILQIPDVRSVFHTADFIAIERKSKGDWQAILALAREAFGAPQAGAVQAGGVLGAGPSGMHKEDSPTPFSPVADRSNAVHPAESFGQASVFVQKFKDIPLQVRVRSGLEEARLALPERFSKAAMRAQSTSPNLIMERILDDMGVRYGDLKEIAEAVIEELDAAYDEERLNGLVEQALGIRDDAAELQNHASKVQYGANDMEYDASNVRYNGNDMKYNANGVRHDVNDTASDVHLAVERLAAFQHPDWKIRYALLDRLKPTLDDLPLLKKALEDDNSSIRRLAAVYLGDIKEPEVLPYLFQALEDKSVSVRRTAGDCLSDIGDARAIQPMIKALKDPNKLVRWRAARFLYEAGDESVVDALREAENDTEFEVSLQVKIALERIEGGTAAEGSVWQQMTRLRT
ncbi:MAG TPA: conserved virulence factor C family protein [Bacilli bacterium]